jgi:hypothetical protein
MPDARYYPGFHALDEGTSAAIMEREAARKADFAACPILADFIATMLQDLQYREADEACEEEREQGDTGTIYTLDDSIYATCKRLCEEFMARNAVAITEALDLIPGEPGLQYGRDYITHESLGSTFYMVLVGHGVGFTDDGDAPCLQALQDDVRLNRGAEFYFDGERVHYC